MTEEKALNAVEKAIDLAYDKGKKLPIQNVMHRFPSNVEILEWWKKQNFQKEQGEQEYTMIFEIDLPKILTDFLKWALSQPQGEERLVYWKYCTNHECPLYLEHGVNENCLKCVDYKSTQDQEPIKQYDFDHDEVKQESGDSEETKFMKGL